MSRILPILFNADMVRAILDGRKTVTRRVIKYPPHPDMPDNHNYCRMPLWMHIGKDEWGFRTLHYMDVIEHEPFMQTRYFESLAPFDKGDILYVRETWAFATCINCNGEYIRKGAPANCYDYQAVEYDDGDSISEGCFIYRADCENPERVTWRPSIHMPKQAARIWLRVTNVKVERLQDITIEGCGEEGCLCGHNGDIFAFMALWDSTLKKPDIARYGWDASPWVWVIEFERCGKPEEE